jgi:hypothetical protein
MVWTRGPVVVTAAVIMACGFPKPADTEGEEEVGGASVPESTHAIRGPDGTSNWLQITCGEAAECYQRASITCPSGFSVYDRDKSTTYVTSGTASTTGVAVDLGNGVAVGGARTQYSSTSIPVDHGQLLVKCGSSEKNDQRLLDQLKALCADGNAKACASLDFATKKRGCCSWHQGVRQCTDHRVVCFDGSDASGDTCGC